MDVRVAVSSPGGHSSVPPPHTVSLSWYISAEILTSGLKSIGILAALLVECEANPQTAKLSRGTLIVENTINFLDQALLRYCNLRHDEMFCCSLPENAKGLTEGYHTINSF